MHDVSPFTRSACEQILSEFGALGLSRCSLLVIPDHHERGNSLANDDFREWLLAQVQAGHEAVVHGYYHLRESRPGETFLQKLTTSYYTAGEGEFYDMDAEGAEERISYALAEFQEAGLQPDGFIAPAWLLSEASEEVLRRLSFQYTTRLRHIIDLQTGRQYASQSLVWSVRTGWRCAASLAWNAALYRKLRDRQLLRISVHPVDIQHPTVWGQIRKQIAAALEDRRAYTYERWLTRQRAMEHAPASHA